MNATLKPVRRVPACGLLIALAGLASIAGCNSKKEQPAAPSASEPPAAAAQQSSAPATAPPVAAPPPIVPAPAVTQASWTPDALEELLAPIALYPDQLLGQILAASVNSQEVLDGGNWLLQNQNLKGNELDAAAQKAGFGPAMRALVQFPTVVDMLCQQIDWTRQVGSAFSSDQKAVLDAVQRLRAQAAEMGNLKSSPQQQVETKTENDKVVVEVKPADPTVVYVPQYDPQVVYTSPPPPPPATTTTTTESTVSTGAAVATGLIAFTAGILIGNAMDDDYCYPHWGAGAVYYGPRPFYPPAYVYRPVYGPAFRPAYGYASPPGYRYNYNNVDVNIDRNVRVNNNDYFNRFDNNQNLRAGGAQSPLNATRQAGTQNRVGQTATANRTEANRAENWKGQSTYAGARDSAESQQLREAAGERPGSRPPATQARAATPKPVGGAGGTRDPSLSSARAQSRDLPAERSQHVDRGYGTSTRAADRDTGAVSRPAQTLDSSSKRENAFAGAGREGSGSFDRAASARGHASSGGRAAGGSRRR